MNDNNDDDVSNLIQFWLDPHSAWKAADVTEEPEIQLIDWTIKEDVAGNRFFVGNRVDTGSGRVSTPIVAFDPERHRGRTQSGRVYELLGRP